MVLVAERDITETIGETITEKAKVTLRRRNKKAENTGKERLEKGKEDKEEEEEEEEIEDIEA